MKCRMIGSESTKKRKTYWKPRKHKRNKGGKSLESSQTTTTKLIM